MTEDTMYKFTFSKSVEFKRVYNFMSPFASSNKFWIPPDSHIIYTSKNKTKNILVKILKISPKIIWEEQCYNITLIGDTTDNFIIQKDNIVEFLELFDLK